MSPLTETALRSAHAALGKGSPGGDSGGRLQAPRLPTASCGTDAGRSRSGWGRSRSGWSRGRPRPPRARRPSPAAWPPPRPRRRPPAAPRPPRPESQPGRLPRDPHPSAMEASAAAGRAPPAETWPREGRGAARRRARTPRKQPARAASVPEDRPSSSAR